MDMHRAIFQLVDNLHDLVCRGTKDYKEALSNVQDYNMTKILTKKASIPDLSGEYKQGKVELDVIYGVQMDIEVFNYIDVIIRKRALNTLKEEITQLEQGNIIEGENDGQHQPTVVDQDDDELKKVDGIFPIKIGPDGLPLRRNNSDCMNNFFIDYATIAFTDVEKIVDDYLQTGEKTRIENFERQVKQKQEDWRSLVLDAFTSQCTGYEEFIRSELDRERLQAEKKSQLAQFIKASWAHARIQNEEKKTQAEDKSLVGASQLGSVESYSSRGHSSAN